MGVGGAGGVGCKGCPLSGPLNTFTTQAPNGYDLVSKGCLWIHEVEL